MTEAEQGVSSRISQYEEFALDPFLVVPLFSEWARKIDGWRLFSIFPLIGGITILVCIYEKSLGSASDLRQIFTIRPTGPSAVELPLARDVASWFFFLVVGATFIVARRQWKLMKKCIPELAKSGALKKVEHNSGYSGYPRYRWYHRLIMRLPKALERTAQETSCEELEVLIRWANRKIRLCGRRGFLIVLAAAAVTLIFVSGVNKGGVFSSWWASMTLAHWLGFAVYFTIITLGIFVAFLQIIIGFFCVYILLSLSTIVELDADWLNRDGRYGWKPIAQVYRSVIFSSALHGLAISVAVFSFGFENVFWMLVFVALWLFAFPLYIVVPYLIFYRVGVDAQQRRIRKIEELFKGATAESNIMDSRCFRDEIKEVHAAKINPLRIRPVILPAFAAVILPVVLTVVQVIIPVWYSSIGGK